MPRIDSFVSKTGRFVLIGDAGHAIVPHLGQGGGMALEDCAALAECLPNTNSVDDLARTMKAFEEVRRTRMDNVRQMAKGRDSQHSTVT